MDLFKPRKALTEHLQKLVESGVIRGVEQAEDFAEIMDGARQPTHGFVYVAHDKSQNFSAQGKSSIKQTEVYTVILAWRNNRPSRSNHSHGMDDSGKVKDAIDWHIHGWLPGGQYHSKSTGKPFVIVDSPQTFYRSGGWAFYPMAFAIDIIRTRTQIT